MSVVAGKRKEGLRAITKARELADHTISLCNNSKHFPVRYRWCFTNANFGRKM
jgi:hypothetical protein